MLCFRSLNPVQYNPYTEPQWRGAVASFETSLVPAENRIAGKLKAQLRNMNANTLQFLQEFKRYQELIRRPSIQRELVAERENLLGKLSEYIGREKKSFRDVGPSRSVPGVPKTVNNVYFVRQLEAKVKDIIKTGCFTLNFSRYTYTDNDTITVEGFLIFAGDMLLADLSSWPKVRAEAEEMVEEMSEFQREQFDSWSRENLQDIESRSLSLQTSSQVVYFEAGKDMKVSYNPRLVGLGREVRMLAMLGFNIPAKIRQTTDLGWIGKSRLSELGPYPVCH